MSQPTNVCYISYVFGGVLFLCIAHSLHRGERDRAKQLVLVAAAVPCALGNGILTPALGAAGKLSLGIAVEGWGRAAVFVLLVKVPRRSFYILYCGLTVTYALNAIVIYADVVATTFAGLFAFVGTSAWLKRRAALVQASQLVAADAARYTALWNAELNKPGAAAALGTLDEAWQAYRAAAVKESKQQPTTFRSVEALFNACDRLNPMLAAISLASSAPRKGGPSTRLPSRARTALSRRLGLHPDPNAEPRP